MLNPKKANIMRMKDELYKKLDYKRFSQVDKTEKFRFKARQIHGNRYDYSKSIYEGVTKEVEIICPIHGSFFQSPQDHINNRSKCPYCGRNRYNKDLFLEAIHKIHSQWYKYYDLHLITYRRALDVIKIECPKHGVFFQRMDVHLRGKGCPKCNNRPYNFNNEAIYQSQTLSILGKRESSQKTQTSYNTTSGDSIIINYKLIN